METYDEATIAEIKARHSLGTKNFTREILIHAQPRPHVDWEGAYKAAHNDREYLLGLVEAHHLNDIVAWGIFDAADNTGPFVGAWTRRDAQEGAIEPTNNFPTVEAAKAALASYARPA